MRMLIQSLLFVSMISLFSYFFADRLMSVNIGMLHLLPIIYAAFRFGRRITLWTSFASVLSFDFFFISPTLTFTVHDFRYIISFAIMIGIGQFIAWLSAQAALAKELEMSKRTQEALLGLLSHELRTPLSAIKGASSGLLDEHLLLDEASVHQLYEIIDESASRMGQLINNLLDSARLQHGHFTPSFNPSDLGEILGSALARIEQTAKAQLHIATDLPLIMADAVLIELLLVNLLDNAFKYSIHVSVRIEHHPLGVLIEVCNDGCIPLPEETSRALLPFERLSNASGHSGVGLGLYICHLISNLHHGTLKVTSNNGFFCVQLILLERLP